MVHLPELIGFAISPISINQYCYSHCNSRTLYFNSSAIKFPMIINPISIQIQVMDALFAARYNPPAGKVINNKAIK
jgi:hypothetical protein